MKDLTGSWKVKVGCSPSLRNQTKNCNHIFSEKRACDNWDKVWEDGMHCKCAPPEISSLAKHGTYRVSWSHFPKNYTYTSELGCFFSILLQAPLCWWELFFVLSKSIPCSFTTVVYWSSYFVILEQKSRERRLFVTNVYILLT